MFTTVLAAIALTPPGRIPRIPLAPLVNAAKLRAKDSAWQTAAKQIAQKENQIERMTVDLHANVLRSGPEQGKKIALTFDDGPHPGATERLLKILAKEKVTATFFVVGFMAQRAPKLVRQIKSGGHQIGNHTYSHATLTRLNRDQVLTEFQASNNVISQITGEPVRYCRPPGGDFNDEVVRNGARLGMTTVLWTLDPADYNNPSPKVLLERELSRLESGTILLLHDGSKVTMDTLPEFIRTAKKRGYQFVSLDEMRAK